MPAARRYIEFALADQMIFELTPDWRARLMAAREHLLEFAQRGGMVGRSRLFDDDLYM